MKSPRALASSLGVSVFLFAGVSLATPGFPAALKADLGLAASPSCGLCHAGQPGPGTVTTPFGKALVAEGLKPSNTASLNAALDALEAKGTDSNGDGVGDIAQLKAGNNPNDGSPLGGTPSPNEGETPEDPKTGCGGHVAPRTEGSALGFAAVAVMLGLAGLRRRRTPR